jgi:hypothetical protein
MRKKEIKKKENKKSKAKEMGHVNPETKRRSILDFFWFQNHSTARLTAGCVHSLRGARKGEEG